MQQLVAPARRGRRPRRGVALSAALALAGCALAACSGAERQEPAPPPAAQEPPAASPQAGAAPAPAPEARPATPKPEPRAPEAPPATPGPETAAPPASEPARQATRPPLDLDALARRLRETHAIGVFTKLKLKNEFDDLLAALRAEKQGHSRTTLSDLRQRYDLLLMKVLAVLDNSDEALSHDLLASREEIWTALQQHATLADS